RSSGGGRRRLPRSSRAPRVGGRHGRRSGRSLPAHERGRANFALLPGLGATELRMNALAAAAADQLVRYPWDVWWFADSVGFEGLIAATELTGEERYRHFGYGLARGWLGRSREGWHRRDYTAPGTAMVGLALRFEDGELLEMLERLADWQIWRPKAGGIALLDPEYALWCWVDCMQFQGPFLT